MQTTALQLFDAGYKDLVSVVPPGAKLSEMSDIPDGSDPAKPDQRGKAPGKYDGNRGHWGGYNWRSFEPLRAHLELWQDAKANIGLHARQFPAIDIDCLEEDVSRELHDLAWKVLGPSPARVGRAPKVLLVYGTAQPFTRLRLHFWRPGQEKAKGNPLIEVLGDGQQFLVAGIHPTTLKPLIYEASASTMFRVPFETIKKGGVNYKLRQRGKVAELALGFQGGENALITMGAYDYGLDDEELTDIKVRWREASPEFPEAWRELNDQCIQAVMHPGVVTEALGGRVRFKVSGGFLWLKLPSGRRLAYCQPKVVWKPAPWDRSREIPGVEAWAVNSKTKQWQKRSIYGGLIFENVVQATARDLMASAMLRLEQAGKYFPLLSVHDEIITEVAEDAADVPEFEQFMCELPQWAEGCPVAADGWAGRRYRK